MSRFYRYMLTATADQRAKLAGIFFGVIMTVSLSVTCILSSGLSNPMVSLVILAIAVISAFVLGYTFYFFIKKTFIIVDARRDQVLGRTPSDHELIELYTWYKTLVKPTSKTIQPILPNYLDYLESQFNGSYARSYMSSKRYKYLFLGESIFFIVVGVLQLLGEQPNLFIVGLNFFAGIMLLVSFIMNRSTEPNRLALRLNAKRLKKVSVMRRQLYE